MADIFQCGLHDFSTNDIIKWDEHCEGLEHEYDLHTECDCGVLLHVKPKQKVSKQSKRIPRGYKCKECQQKVIDAPDIKEAGEITNV